MAGGRPRRPTSRDTDARRVGLARALSKLGYCSRSRASELIQAGRVRLNGVAQRNPEAPVLVGKDRIEIDRQTIGAEAKFYLILNKPRGLVTTASDEKGRQTVYSCLKPGLPFVSPIGRLDKASEGLLLLTNDTAWAARVAAPESHLDKTYHVQIGAAADAALAATVVKGIRTPDGGVLRAKRAEILRRGEKNTWLTVVLDEGKNRQIRRIFEALGIEVLRLVRVGIGPVALGELPKRGYRELTVEEKSLMDAALRQVARIAR
jgi:23S rRNA pseudouridine2605 synthase